MSENPKTWLWQLHHRKFDRQKIGACAPLMINEGVEGIAIGFALHHS
jgi:hypothetical protein